MNVNTLLNLLGERKLSDVSPEGLQVIDLINKYSANKYDISTLNGVEALGIINTFAEDQKLTVLSIELNDGLDLSTYRKELQALVDAGGAGKWMRPLLAFGFSTLMAVLALGYAAAVGWVAYQNKTLPDWPSLLIIIGGPVMVVWQYYGILTQERRDLLTAALGRTPQGGVMSALLGTLKVRKDDSRLSRRSLDRDPGEYDPSKPKGGRG